MAPRASSVSVTLSGETRTELDRLADRFGVDRSELIERLVWGSAQHSTTEGATDATGD